MESTAASSGFRQIPDLLRGEPAFLSGWLTNWNARRTWLCIAVIALGAGIYGAAMGCWRAPQQALYTAIKFPLIIALTTLGNALLNGMLAPLLGLNLRFRQSLLAILLSFTIAATILAAFSPLIFFLVWNLPAMSGAERLDTATFSFIKLIHVAIIAFAGVTANVHLGQLLRQLSGDAAVARRVLFAWLAGNLLLGSQLCWILRPFFGSPLLAVQFFRADPLHGNFYENLFRALRDLIFS